MKRKPKTISDLDQKIGARVRAIRISAGMTQGEVAKKLGVVYAQVQKYEYGQNRVSLSAAIRLAEILECDLTDFVPEHAGAAANLQLWSSRTMAIANMIDGLEEADTKLIYQIAKRLSALETQISA